MRIVDWSSDVCSSDLLFPDLHIVVIGISRDGRGCWPTPDDDMRAGDEGYVGADTRHLSRTMAAVGHEEKEARRVIIIGGGNIGLNLAHAVEKNQPQVNLKVIEVDKRRAEEVAQSLQRTVVIHGNALDTEILEEANAAATDTVIAVSNDDEVNILTSLLAKRYGCRRAVTLINKATYGPLIAKDRKSTRLNSSH